MEILKLVNLFKFSIKTFKAFYDISKRMNKNKSQTT